MTETEAKAEEGKIEGKDKPTQRTREYKDKTRDPQDKRPARHPQDQTLTRQITKQFSRQSQDR